MDLYLRWRDLRHEHPATPGVLALPVFLTGYAVGTTIRQAAAAAAVAGRVGDALLRTPKHGLVFETAPEPVAEPEPVQPPYDLPLAA